MCWQLVISSWPQLLKLPSCFFFVVCFFSKMCSKPFSINIQQWHIVSSATKSQQLTERSSTWAEAGRSPSPLIISRVSRCLLACSTTATLAQCGLSTRRRRQCSSLRCVHLQLILILLLHHLLHSSSKYWATTSCRSRLHSSFCLRPLCSRGGSWKVRPPRNLVKNKNEPLSILLSSVKKKTKHPVARSYSLHNLYLFFLFLF